MVIADDIVNALDDPWIPVDRAAEWAGCTEADIIDYVATGEVRWWHLGDVCRVKERDVGEAFGLPLPGPRQIELTGDDAEARLQVTDELHRWSSVSP